MDKEIEEDILYLKEMLDLQEVLDPEEFCFEKRRFDNNFFYHKCHKLDNTKHTSNSNLASL